MQLGDVERRGARDLIAYRLERSAGLRDRLIEAIQLRGDVLPSDGGLGGATHPMARDEGRSDGDRAGGCHSDALEGDGHSGSPKRSRTRASIAARAASSSSPLASTTIWLPLLAASIMTPMMLLPFTR